ncbi:SusC/RagA family TonB-linked outer membrane protein [Spirosoma fluviale]|uniref:TonB-linked outer membrane protein, SusC/RagA family n=1 Tax=Spirosoma fluviale TaxID=1597977 RepID=A0A286GA24_9BACT|nr:TonB-dependent receptor [Spirosoma fluviale]SOD92387.1 TonB-linked outer membrane protein, SusC/RagA family [Spirosoma fluviale]
MKNFLLLLLITWCSLLATNASAQQERQVTGKVTSAEDGNPLPGVSIVAKGTTRGTQTDADGNYTLSVPVNIGTLVYSFVGVVTQEVSIGNRAAIDVALSNDTRSLDEVIVTGYGAQSKRNLTGNIAKVGARDIENIPVPSVEQALQGRVAGVQITSLNGKVGQGLQIRVRGTSSLTASSQPLYVIDGIPLTSSDQSSTTAPTNPIADLNPNDIESLEILKDASSAAIYGSRASNGVVLITTKKGRAAKTSFEASAQMGASNPTHLREWLNTQQYVELLQEARANTGATSATSLANRLTRYAAGDPAGWQGENPKYNTDWQQEAFQKAPSQQYDLSARGGDAKTRFFISGQYFDQTGIIIKNRFRRLSGRVNLDHTATDKLTLGVNFNLSHSINDRVSNDNAFSTPMQIVALSPMTPVIDPRTGRVSGADPDLFPSYPLYYNPLINRDYANLQARVYRMIGNVYADYKLLPGLSFRTEFGTDLLSQQEEEYYGRETRGNTGAPNGLGSNTFRQVANYTTNNYFSFGRTFAEKHDVDATLGMSYQESRNNYSSVTGQQFPSSAYKQITSAARITAGDGQETSFSFLSYFARVNYRFNNRYLVGISGRIDGSSRFGTNNRYGFFPAASAGWILTEESFLKNVKALSLLKLRASYGLTGNAEIGNFSSLALYAATNNAGTSAGYAGVPGQAPSQIPNPDLTWEKTLQTDIGLEFGFLNNRFSGEIDYYQKNTSGLLLNVNVPGSSGFRTQLRNVGKLENKGVEFVFNSNNFNGPFKWTTSLNLSYNKNVITDLGGTTITGSFLNRAQEGQPLGVFVGPEYAGVDPANGDALYYRNSTNADGSIDRSTTNSYNDAAYVPLGNPAPKFIGGITNTFSYAGFDLSVLFNGQFGNYIYNGGGKFQSANGDFFDNQSTDQLNRWRNPGDITNVPQARLLGGNGTGESSRYLQKGDYVRLRTITLGYTLPKELLTRIHLSRVRIFATGQNLLTFTKYTGWDPEVNSDAYTGNPVNLGIDFYSAPQPRTIIGGLQIGF